MDISSAAVVAAVLSLGAALVYLFKRDFERRDGRPSAAGQGSSKKTLGSNQAASHRTNVKAPSSKTVAAAGDAAAIAKQVPIESNHKSHSHSRQPASQAKSDSSPASCSNGSNNITNNNNNNNNIKSASNGARQPAPLDAASAPKKRSASKESARVEPAPIRRHLSGVIPAPDELDSSLLGSAPFNPASRRELEGVARSVSNGLVSAGQAQNGHSPKTSVERRNSLSSKRKQTLELLTGTDSLVAAYSSEKLFNLIAASNLSREEIEQAVETLLNKLDSKNDCEWKHPKSHPLQRLKSQLRDSELALVAAHQSQEKLQAHCKELKGQLREEKSAVRLHAEQEERLKKEIGLANLALDKARRELDEQQARRAEHAKLAAKLEAELEELKAALASSLRAETELREELTEKRQQVERHEAAQQALLDKVQALEAKLAGAEGQLEQGRAHKQQDDYEACAKISELEAESLRLEQTVKEKTQRIKEALEANNQLQRSVSGLEAANGRQEELLKRLRDERHVSETFMKRTLSDMERELNELQEKLQSSLAANETLAEVEAELEAARARERKLTNELQEIGNSLALELAQNGFASNNGSPKGAADISEHLAAIKELKSSLQKLKAAQPVPVDEKQTLRNGQPQKGSVELAEAGDAKSKESHEKKLIDTKMLELNYQVEQLKEQLRSLKEEKDEAAQEKVLEYEKQIKDLKMHKSKLEAQVKFGLDSLRMEQERIQKLEEEVARLQA